MYFTLTEFKEIFGDREAPIDDNNNDDTVKFEKVNKRVSQYIDTHLSSAKLTVPVSDDNIICQFKDFGYDIVRYYLNDDHVSEPIEKRFNEAKEFFNKISSGKINLVFEDKTEEQLLNENTLHTIKIIR